MRLVGMRRVANAPVRRHFGLWKQQRIRREQGKKEKEKEKKRKMKRLQTSGSGSKKRHHLLPIEVRYT
jgi:hypothetical protein